MSLELKKAIEQISKDRGLDRDMLISTLEEAVRTSVTRKYGDDLDVEVHYSDDTGDIEVFQFKFVVDEVEDPKVFTISDFIEAQADGTYDNSKDENYETNAQHVTYTYDENKTCSYNKKDDEGKYI